MTTDRLVDHAAIRTSQVFTITLLALAFVLNLPALAGFVAAVMLISAVVPALGLFRRIYLHILRPAGIVKPDVIADNPEPHRFAQAVGGTCVALGVLALAAGVSAVGWGLVVMVIGLAGLNLLARWCAGCTLYYWLNRAGVPGFTRSRIEMTQ